ncbi:hypothetical protein GOP47_0025180 [Adiantum capillus-veneris]|uniref:Uncharacterized protein n=1 Tax=Adiantum capillus-veneris TaxID=13818 RepID=A0A9D4Z4C5_ADICA|nr:hypothetical protein GOP47_0025180 [Adiantum capillus-veneris]
MCWRHGSLRNLCRAYSRTPFGGGTKDMHVQKQSIGCASSGCSRHGESGPAVGGKEGAVKHVGVLSSHGMWFLPYRIVDDIPFEEDILQDLPIESAQALGIYPRSGPSDKMSFFSGCSISNCVLNVYVGKENMSMGDFGK